MGRCQAQLSLNSWFLLQILDSEKPWSSCKTSRNFLIIFHGFSGTFLPRISKNFKTNQQEFQNKSVRISKLFEISGWWSGAKPSISPEFSLTNQLEFQDFPKLFPATIELIIFFGNLWLEDSVKLSYKLEEFFDIFLWISRNISPTNQQEFQNHSKYSGHGAVQA